MLFFKQGMDSGIKIPHLDKVAHFVVFAGLAFLLDMGFNIKKAYAITLLSVYGFAVEMIQDTLPTRTASIGDMVADVCGIFCYYLFLRTFLKPLFEKDNEQA